MNDALAPVSPTDPVRNGLVNISRKGSLLRRRADQALAELGRLQAGINAAIAAELRAQADENERSYVALTSADEYVQGARDAHRDTVRDLRRRADELDRA